jgi:hypothetical protein
MRGKEGIKLKMEPKRAKKVSSMINSINQQNMKINNNKN